MLMMLWFDLVAVCCWFELVMVTLLADGGACVVCGWLMTGICIRWWCNSVGELDVDDA
jgi:hypothetical protein